MRRLKFHEQKLLKKVDFFDWKRDRKQHELKVIRRYHLQDREDYSRYNRIVGVITKLTHKLKQLPSSDKFRIKLTEQLLNKLYNIGLINAKDDLGKT